MKAYKIEHKVRDPKTNLLKDLEVDDLSIENHPGVRRAFKLFYKFHLQKRLSKI